MSQPKRVLITGATGLLGTFVIRELLQKDILIRALFRNPKKILPEFSACDNLEWFQCDIIDTVALYEATQNCDIIIHAAALIQFDKKSHKEMYKVNVEGTANLVNAALHSKVEKIIYISSVTSLPAISGNHLIDEDDNWNIEPYPSYYAWTKFLAEKEIYRGEVEGLDILILNPSSIFGPGNWQEGPSLFFSETAKGNLFYTKGSGGFIDVRDLVSIILTGIFNPEFKGQFIASAWNANYQDVQDLIATRFKKAKPIFPFTFPIIELAVCFDYIVSSLLKRQRKITLESAQIANLKTLYNNEKLSKKLSFHYHSLEETIDWVCSAYTLTQDSKM